MFVLEFSPVYPFAVALFSYTTKGTRTRGQACTVALGCLIFFDDYSSILIVGNSLRDVVGAVGVSKGGWNKGERGRERQ